MINHNSSPDDINYHMQQMQLIILSQDECLRIERVLNSMLEEQEMKEHSLGNLCNTKSGDKKLECDIGSLVNNNSHDTNTITAIGIQIETKIDAQINAKIDTELLQSQRKMDSKIYSEIHSLLEEEQCEDMQALMTRIKRRKAKDDIIREHLEGCKGLMLYKILESKCHHGYLEVVYQNKDWVFTEVDNRENKARWIQHKFSKLFYDSSLESSLSQIVQEGTPFKINHEWLYKNKEVFYSSRIFESLDFVKNNETHIK